jgi:hypothetical protein
MKTIKEFCDKYDACRDGRAWALTHCKDMNEVWQTARPEWLVWVATRNGVLTDVELRRFAVWASRQVQHLLTDERSVNALDVAERYVNGAATDEELATARDAAADAADADRAAACAAAYAADAAYAAADAADAAAYAAARAAAYAADAADAAARTTCAAAAHAAAESAQAQWLRENTKPNFA